MTDASEPRRCAGCGAVEGGRQVLKAKTDTKPAVFTTVTLRPVKILDWQRLLCRRCSTRADKVIDHVTDLHLMV